MSSNVPGSDVGAGTGLVGVVGGPLLPLVPAAAVTCSPLGVGVGLGAVAGAGAAQGVADTLSVEDTAVGTGLEDPLDEDAGTALGVEELVPCVVGRGVGDPLRTITSILVLGGDVLDDE